MAQKRIFPASLKLILKLECQLPVLRPAPEISVQPDSVIGKHRAGENSTSSECDPSPRRAAVVTRSEEPGTPPHSPAISTVSGPEGEVFSFEDSRDVFLRSKCTSLEEEYILLQVQPEVGMDDSNNANTSQATTREESARLFLASTKGWQRGQPTKANSLIGEDFCDEKFLSSEEIFCLYCLCFVFFRLFSCVLSYFAFFPLCRRSRYERRNESLFGCTGCVMLHQGAFTISSFSPMKGIFCIQYLFVFSIH